MKATIIGENIAIVITAEAILLYCLQSHQEQNST